MRELDIADFLNAKGILLDVRSPKEFNHARVPEALNLPLFTDEERAAIGTLYKQEGHDAAVEKGFEYVGPKLKNIIQMAKEMVKDEPAKIYCARGGLRSASMAWALETAGLNTIRLKNGYKAFRSFCLTFDIAPLNLIVIGGLTGSGKTDHLHQLKISGSQVLDLEQLAKHRGSSYGALPDVAQISTEQFENEIASQLQQFDLNRPIYIEDESRMIGKCKIPQNLFLKMQQSPLHIIEKPFNERVDQLKKTYGSLKTEDLILATKRIEKRLGSLRTKQIIAHIESGSLQHAIEMVLKYYDSTYLAAINRRSKVTV